MHDFTQPTTPPRKTGCGCLLNLLGGLVALILAVLGAGWLILMHSSWPLRSVANIIESAGEPSHLKITGVSGSLSSGLHFQTMQWDDGELADVRFDYTGLLDVIRNKQLIIRQLHVGKAVINIDATSSDHADSTDSTQPAASSPEWPLRLLQIDQLTLTDIVVRNRATGFTLTIPSLQWTGFKAEKGSVNLGNLHAQSDYLALTTTDAPTPQYQKRIDCVLMPKLHPRIRKPIRIVMDLTTADKNMALHLVAFDGALEIVANTDGSSRIDVRGLKLADYVEGPLPQDITLEVVAEPGADAHSNPLTLRRGSFQLGTRKFEIQPAKWPEHDQPPQTGVFHATSDDGAPKFSYEIYQSDKNKPIIQRLTSDPQHELKDTLALLFHGCDFSALTEEQKQQLIANLPFFEAPTSN